MEPHEAIERYLRLADAMKLLANNERMHLMVMYAPGEDGRRNIENGLLLSAMDEIKALMAYGMKYRKKPGDGE